MAVSYRQGCEAAAATALSDGMVLAHTCTDTHTHFHMDVIEAAYMLSLTHAHLYSFRWNRICSNCAAFMDAMQELRHYYL